MSVKISIRVTFPHQPKKISFIIKSHKFRILERDVDDRFL